MTDTFTAIYEDGVLRPTTALPYAEGSRVQVTVVPMSDGLNADGSKSTTDEPGRHRREDVADLIKSLADAKGADDLPDDYDFLEALNENRRLSGDYRMLFPPEEKGKT
jgi:predicted DNA-binding antitoxin AbrB/MazE fold protein